MLRVLRHWQGNKDNPQRVVGNSFLNGTTIMKLVAIALAAAFALSSSFALASTHHKKHRGSASMYRSHYGTHHTGRRYGGSSNNRGGLVGGADPGTYKS